ncbi:MAG TPA: ABC transporter substrate-binding protein [Gemmataceae bacterium]|nr:ABC transporter substrate-binding protein [Gemmataceae bacterium]
MNRRDVPRRPHWILATLCLAAAAALALTPLAGVRAPAAHTQGAALEVPFILWGGDVATFLANEGLTTKPDSIFEKQGLTLKLTRGDDFQEQVKNYLSGKSPFLRGTFSMLGQASESLSKDPAARPVIFLQLTWSAGDHLVTRANSKMLSDIKGKKIALQKGGPHVGMLGDILRTARLKWDDITTVYTDDVTGDKGPAALFKKDSSVDACFAITPDMAGLTGGFDKTGDGASGTIKGAHVLVSTAHMKRSIADVYACRKDFYEAHKDVIEKFVAGYLKGCEELLELKKKYAVKDPDATPRYKALLGLTMQIYGKDVATEDDADGLISDAVFVGLPGNISFFTDRGNLSGYEGKQKAALDLAVALGDAKARHEFIKADLDYEKVKGLGQLTGKALPENRFKEDVKVLPENTLYSFSISFEPNQSVFPEAKYGEDFQRALEQASLFGNSIVVARGHADPYSLLELFEKQGLAKQILVKKGDDLELKDGTKVDLNDVKKVAEIIEKEDFGNDDLKKSAKYLMGLSKSRADGVRNALVKYAESKGYRLDKSQIRAAGAGCLEPVVAIPKQREDYFKNRRVEFRIVKVTIESSSEIDY